MVMKLSPPAVAAPSRRASLVVAFCLLATVASGEPAPGLAPEAVEQIDAAVEAWRAKSHAPALSAAVVKDNQLIWSKGYGFADVEQKLPARSDTVYRLASVTKSITAIAVMQLVEAGKLDLDAPIQQYCPSYPQKQWTVTSRHLLTHMAGVRHNKWGETTSTRHYASITDAIAVFKDDALLFEPGRSTRIRRRAMCCWVERSRTSRAFPISSTCRNASSRPPG
jgi:CubicO group peptidase (beta-lactamase class C family)